MKTEKNKKTNANIPSSRTVGVKAATWLVVLFLGLTGSGLVKAQSTNIALGKPSSQSSDAPWFDWWKNSPGYASKAVDGGRSTVWGGGSISHTYWAETGQWWKVDLQASHDIGIVRIYSRTDYWVLDDFIVTVFNANNDQVWQRHYNNPVNGYIDVNVGGVRGRYVEIRHQGTVWANPLCLAEVEVYEAENLALGKSASQSSTYEGCGANRVVDGNIDGNYNGGSVSHTNADQVPWVSIDMGWSEKIGNITLYNRTDCCSERLSDYEVRVLNGDGNVVWRQRYNCSPRGSITLNAAGVDGRYVVVVLNRSEYLHLAEVKVFRSNGDHPVDYNGGTFTITNAGSGLLLGASFNGSTRSTAVDLLPGLSEPTQNWQQHIMTDGSICLENIHTGKYLTHDSNTGAVVQSAYTAANNQKWRIEGHNGFLQIYTISNVQSGRLLAGNGGSVSAESGPPDWRHVWRLQRISSNNPMVSGVVNVTSPVNTGYIRPIPAFLSTYIQEATPSGSEQRKANRCLAVDVGGFTAGWVIAPQDIEDSVMWKNQAAIKAFLGKYNRAFPHLFRKTIGKGIITYCLPNYSGGVKYAIGVDGISYPAVSTSAWALMHEYGHHMGDNVWETSMNFGIDGWRHVGTAITEYHKAHKDLPGNYPTNYGRNGPPWEFWADNVGMLWVKGFREDMAKNAPNVYSCVSSLVDIEEVSKITY